MCLAFVEDSGFAMTMRVFRRPCGHLAATSRLKLISFLSRDALTVAAWASVITLGHTLRFSTQIHWVPAFLTGSSGGQKTCYSKLHKFCETRVKINRPIEGAESAVCSRFSRQTDLEIC